MKYIYYKFSIYTRKDLENLRTQCTHSSHTHVCAFSTSHATVIIYFRCRKLYEQKIIDFLHSISNFPCATRVLATFPREVTIATQVALYVIHHTRTSQYIAREIISFFLMDNLFVAFNAMRIMHICIENSVEDIKIQGLNGLHVRMS